MFKAMAEEMLRELTVAVQEMQQAFCESQRFLDEVYTTLTHLEGIWKQASGPVAIADVSITMTRGELRMFYGTRSLSHSKHRVQGPCLLLTPSPSGGVTLTLSEGWSPSEAPRQATLQKEIPCDLPQTIAVILQFLKASEIAYRNIC